MLCCRADATIVYMDTARPSIFLLRLSLMTDGRSPLPPPTLSYGFGNHTAPLKPLCMYLYQGTGPHGAPSIVSHQSCTRHVNGLQHATYNIGGEARPLADAPTLNIILHHDVDVSAGRYAPHTAWRLLACCRAACSVGLRIPRYINSGGRASQHNDFAQSWMRPGIQKHPHHAFGYQDLPEMS